MPQSGPAAEDVQCLLGDPVLAAIGRKQQRPFAGKSRVFLASNRGYGTVYSNRGKNEQSPPSALPDLLADAVEELVGPQEQLAVMYRRTGVGPAVVVSKNIVTQQFKFRAGGEHVGSVVH